jgi:hypothetical protein
MLKTVTEMTRMRGSDTVAEKAALHTTSTTKERLTIHPSHVSGYHPRLKYRVTNQVLLC